MLLSSTLEPVSGRALMHWLLTVTLLTLPSLAGAEARKTLEECIEIALRQQPTLRAAYRLRDVAEETVAQNEKHVDLAQGRHDVGLAPRFDVTNAQVQLATAELNRVTARNNVSLGRETLRNALGLLGPLDFDIVDSLE